MPVGKRQHYSKKLKELEMELLIPFLIYLGAGLMVTNIYRFYRFIRSTEDVLSADSQRDKRWMYLAICLLIFFLCGYVFVGFISDPDLMMALILFFGSVFVAIVLTLLFHLMETAKTRSIDIAEVLISAVEARDPNLTGHSRYVQNVTMLFYRHLPYNLRKQINPVSLEFASLMHDVGKLGVPESILNKPGRLDEKEWKVIQGHPRIGVRILKPLSTFDAVAPWIEYHHERPDGKGYYGIPDKDIPLAAKIISIADTYSTITMRRVYKAPRTHEDAIRIIRKAAGTQLDAQLTAIFVKIPKDELKACIPEGIKY